MESQPSTRIKFYGIIALSIFCTGAVSADTPILPVPNFTIVPFERPLSIYSFPVQEGLANSVFNYNLAPHISKLKPEIDYSVSSLMKGGLDWLGIQNLPAGVTQDMAGEGVCNNKFGLNPGQKCILRLIIDKSKYTPTYPILAPRVCLDSGPPHYFPLGFCFDTDYKDMLVWLIDLAPTATNVTVKPESEDGLSFDPVGLKITGIPARAGLFTFTVRASNNQATAEERTLNILVKTDPKDKPVFKTKYNIASAMPNQNYQLNLIDLLEATPGFMVTNQVSFRIVDSLPHPDWLSLDKTNPTVLRGHPADKDAGLMESISFVATSNTGGDSEPVTIKIPVAFDPAKKPVISSNITLTGVAGAEFHNDFRLNISDPAVDRNLQVLIDKVEPAASWLKVSTYNPTEIVGVVDKGDAGKEYQITLRARTEIGGVSDPVTIPLNIAINKNKTPHFYQDNPQLPLLYTGQPWSHDFVANNDVYPEYGDVPYTIELAKDPHNPVWVRIENNKLVIDMVPDNLEQIERVFITIKNVPGGKSDVLALKLFVMN